MKRLSLVLCTLVCLSGSALAQDCIIGVYTDPLGQSPPWYMPTDGQVFSLYVVIFTEDTVAAAAYSMTYPLSASGMFLVAFLATVKWLTSRWPIAEPVTRLALKRP